MVLSYDRNSGQSLAGSEDVWSFSWTQMQVINVFILFLLSLFQPPLPPFVFLSAYHFLLVLWRNQQFSIILCRWKTFVLDLYLFQTLCWSCLNQYSPVPLLHQSPSTCNRNRELGMIKCIWCVWKWMHWEEINIKMMCKLRIIDSFKESIYSFSLYWFFRSMNMVYFSIY